MCNQLVDFLRRRGFEVTLVGLGRPPPAWLARHGGAFPWQASALRRNVRSLTPAPDLIVTVGPFGWPSRARAGPPHRVHIYASNLARLARYQDGRWHWRVRWGLAAGMCEALAARGATTVAISEHAAEDAARLYRVKVESVLGLGVDTDLFFPRDRDAARRRLGLAPDQRYGLFAGRAEAAKGQDIALDGCQQLGWELLVAGPVARPGSRSLGVLADEDLAWAYAAADAVVFPTAYEGWGYVVVEALAAGVPVVTTPVGWARELGRVVRAYRPLLVRREAAAVAGALDLVASGAADAAVEQARALVLDRYTVADFERRWSELLTRMGVVGD